MLCTKKDIPWLTQLLSEPTVFENCSDDGVSPKQKKRHVMSLISRPDIVVLSPKIGAVVVTFVAQNSIMWDMHIAVKPGYGVKAKEIREWVTNCCRWMVKNRNARKFMARIPAFNKAAQRMAAAGGLKRTGVFTSAFLKRGILHDLVIYQSDDVDVNRVLGE